MDKKILNKKSIPRGRKTKAEKERLTEERIKRKGMNPTKFDVLCLHAEGKYTMQQIAKLVGKDVSTVSRLISNATPFELNYVASDENKIEKMVINRTYQVFNRAETIVSIEQMGLEKIKELISQASVQHLAALVTLIKTIHEIRKDESAKEKTDKSALRNTLAMIEKRQQELQETVEYEEVSDNN